MLDGVTLMQGWRRFHREAGSRGRISNYLQTQAMLRETRGTLQISSLVQARTLSLSDRQPSVCLSLDTPRCVGRREQGEAGVVRCGSNRGCELETSPGSAWRGRMMLRV